MAGTVAIVTMTAEIENKQIHILLSRPIARFEIVMGKFVTVAILVVISNFIIGLVLWGMAIGIESPEPMRIFWALNFLSMEGCIVAAVALFFGVASSSLMSATFTALVFIIGRLSGILKLLIDSGNCGTFRPLLMRRIISSLTFICMTLRNGRKAGRHQVLVLSAKPLFRASAILVF